MLPLTCDVKGGVGNIDQVLVMHHYEMSEFINT
jgi:hypothetical protein